MFQSFDSQSSPQASRERVTALRERFDALGIDGFMVPRADEYQGEYVPACSERLAWLTGFTGSAGVALIMRRQAMVFVDGRYTTQLSDQVDGEIFTGGDLVGAPPHVWLGENGPHGFRLGVDSWLHTGSDIRKLEAALDKLGGSLVPLGANPVDALWTDRPAQPQAAISLQTESYSGASALSKIADMAKSIEGKADAVLITDPSSVAWIFNIRGNDVPHTPHPLARAVIHADGTAEIFLDRAKTGIETEAYLAQMARRLQPCELEARLSALSESGGRIAIDADLTPVALTAIIRGAGGETVETGDPARLPRACKNAVELNGSAAAHLQDGVAMVEFLAWLSQREPGTVTEIAATRSLETARQRVGDRMQNPLKDVSFDTIAGAGEHAAIMHYRVTTLTDRVLNAGEMFLIDSGGQYVNGTTDITRTVAIGDVPVEQRRFFTLVLKGMIAISMARFPAGTRGCDLDPLARNALWQAGADYAHGTGHGVGSYLSVHEGPQRIARLSTQELLPGMILSNEPGYYRPGAFGIRIENLVYVRPAEEIEGGDLPMLGFETLTWCPIDRNLILSELLTRDETLWLNAYHEKTRDMLLPLIDDELVRDWLANATRAITPPR